MSGWTIGYVVCNQISLLIVYLLANRQESGVATYTAAYIYFILPHALVAVSIMTTFIPELASAARVGDFAIYRERFSAGVRLMALIILPAATGYLLLAKPIIGALLDFGAVEQAQADLTSDNLAMFAVGAIGYSVYLFTLRGFYALQDTRTPFFLNLFENGLNLALAVALLPLLGVPGLALAYGFAYLVAGAVALLALRRRVGSLDMTRIVRSFTRIGLACIVMAIAVAVATRLVSPDDLVQTAAGVLTGAIVFGAGVLLFRVEEVDVLRSRFLRR
jgi:putative peptidoglycan lipid II flippase